jgi:hypothetical protein
MKTVDYMLKTPYYGVEVEKTRGLFSQAQISDEFGKH